MTVGRHGCNLPFNIEVSQVASGLDPSLHNDHTSRSRVSQHGDVVPCFGNDEWVCSQGTDPRLQDRRAHRQAVTLVIRDHVLRGAGWICEATANSSDRAAYRLGIEIEQVFDEGVGVDGPNAVRVQDSVRKVPDVERHNFLSPTVNGSREHMAVVGIG